MKTFIRTIAALGMAASLLLPALAQAELPADEVALVIQLRGKALVERNSQSPFEAVIKSPIERKDIIETLKRSRAKMLFTDESIMTLGPESRASVKEFVSGMEAREGATVFNLMSGQMRTVVGKSDFQVHTPTVVAAARGTVIEFTVAEVDGKAVTVVSCLEGTVEIRSQDPSIEGVLILKAGETIVVYEGQDPSALEPMPTADYSGLPGKANVVTTIETRTIDSILTPSIVITPPVDVAPEQPSPTPVIVDVVFPDNRIQQ